jgi:hypothetical protein
MAAVLIRQVADCMQHQSTVAGVLDVLLPEWKGGAGYAFFIRPGSHAGQRALTCAVRGSRGIESTETRAVFKVKMGFVSGRCGAMERWEREGGMRWHVK